MHVVRKIKVILILTFLFLLPLLCSFLIPGPFRLWNAQVNDLCFQLRFLIKGAVANSPDFYVFNITNSLELKYQGSLSDRKFYATVLEKLHTARIRTILWDIFYSVDSKTDGDLQLATATNKIGNVYYPFYFDKQTTIESLPQDDFLTTNIRFTPSYVKQKKNADIIKPGKLHYPAFAQAAAGLGFSNPSIDNDGIQRRLPLVCAYGQGSFLPSLVLAGICSYLQVDTTRIEIYFGKYIKLPNARHYGVTTDFLIPIDNKGCLIINFPGPASVHQSLMNHYPLDIVMHAFQEEESVLPELLKDNFVFIGDTSTSGKDFTRGIFDTEYPNSFVLSNALNTILSENFLSDSYPVKNCMLVIVLISQFFLFWLITSNRSAGSFIFFFLIFVFINILLISGINFLCFILLNNLTWTVELIWGTICAACGLFALKFYTTRSLFPAELPAAPLLSPVIAANSGTSDPAAALNAMGIVTKRQLETALLIIEGLSNKEIADKLCITVYAVRRRIQKIYEKCNTKKRAEFIKKVYGIQ